MIWFVDVDAAGSDNGLSWTNAFTDLQDAISDANYGHEIWVAQGTYKPTDGNDRTISFSLTSGLAVYGGFAGTETSRYSRDWDTYPVTLSGDINIPGDINDNSYHVVVGAASAVLDGLTVTKGCADGSDNNHFGGGIYNSSDGLTIANCTITENHTLIAGGGLFNGGDLTVTDSIFSENTSDYTGGGLSNGSPIGAGDLLLTNCVFTGNSGIHGGGLYSFVDLILTNCVIAQNSGTYGGGMYVSQSEPVLANCTFYDNSASTYGGAMYNNTGALPILINCIFWDDDVNGVSDEIYNYSTADSYISYSCIEGSGGSGSWDPNFGTDGGGNIDSDPCFADSSDPDGSDNIFMTYDDGLRITTDGSCVDAADGDNALSADILDRIYVDIDDVNNTGTGDPNYVDMGAYEYGCDTDGDGIDDDWEVSYGFDPTNASDAGNDSDSDDLTNLGEYNNNTNPLDSDCDDDSITDGWEVQYGLDPLNASDGETDLDSDTYSNVVEFLHNSDPNNDANFPLKPTSIIEDFDDDGDGVYDREDHLIELTYDANGNVTEQRNYFDSVNFVLNEFDYHPEYNFKTGETTWQGLCYEDGGSVTKTGQKVEKLYKYGNVDGTVGDEPFEDDDKYLVEEHKLIEEGAPDTWAKTYFTYNAGGQVISKTNPVGNIDFYERNADGFVIKEWNGATLDAGDEPTGDPQKRYNYDEFGKCLLKANYLNKVERNFYNVYGNITYTNLYEGTNVMSSDSFDNDNLVDYPNEPAPADNGYVSRIGFGEYDRYGKAQKTTLPFGGSVWKWTFMGQETGGMVYLEDGKYSYPMHSRVQNDGQPIFIEYGTVYTWPGLVYPDKQNGTCISRREFLYDSMDRVIHERFGSRQKPILALEYDLHKEYGYDGAGNKIYEKIYSIDPESYDELIGYFDYASKLYPRPWNVLVNANDTWYERTLEKQTTFEYDIFNRMTRQTVDPADFDPDTEDNM
ncbi:hypothetical protein ACFL3G_13320 [Planctomycetota bacterium]